MVGSRWSGRGWDAPHASAGVLVARRASRVAQHAAERPHRTARYFDVGPNKVQALPARRTVRPGRKHGEDALNARRHGKPSAHCERWHVQEPRHAHRARAAHTRDDGSRGRGGERVRRGGGGGGQPDVLCAGAQRGLAGLAARPAAQPRAGDRVEQLPNPHPRDVRELSRGAAHRKRPPWPSDRSGDRGGKRRAAGGSAAHLSRRLRLPGVCTPGGAARTRPLYPRGGRSAGRRRVSVHRLALSALALRSTVHARHLPARVARPRGRPVGAEGGLRRREPRGGRPHGERREAHGMLGEDGSGVCRLEPGAARAGCWRSPQRHARAAHPGGSARPSGRLRRGEHDGKLGHG
jgi:hypothetical protein